MLGKLLHVLNVDPKRVLRKDEGVFAGWSRSSRQQDSPTIPDELQFELVKEQLHERVYTNQSFKELAKSNGIDEQNLRRTRGAEAYVENRRRLEVAGDAFFVKRLIDAMSSAGPEVQQEFAEISRCLRKLGAESVNRGVLAAAYQVVAGDLLWMQSPLFRTGQTETSRNPQILGCSYPALLRARMLAELPEQAMECAKRIRKNMVMEARASDDAARPIAGAVMRETRNG